MKLTSCQNCWFNGLQYGAVGLSIGYCTRHRRVLNFADGTTCGLHIRKDLGLSRAQQVAAVHSEAYSNDRIVRWMDKSEVQEDTSGHNRDIAVLQQDEVGNAVCDYGFLDSKIESLSQLGAMNTPRSDVALASLSRAYVNNCINQRGRWTSGIHLFWWMKKRLSTIPSLHVSDLRFVGSTQLARQVELTAWSIMMLRLTFIDDIVNYASRDGDQIGQAKDLLNEATVAVSIFNTKKLGNWLSKEVIPLLDARMDQQRYQQISRELHKETSRAIEDN